MILVTGGTGLVGAHLLLKLAEQRNKIKAIYRPESDLHKTLEVFSYYHPKDEAERLFKRIEWVIAEITDVPQLTEAFKDITQVYHCAALVSFNPKEEKALRKINIEGTANIVNLCIDNKIEKLCYVSSIASLGKPIIKSEPTTETTNWNPEANNSDYAISKYGAEIEVWRASQEGVKVIIVNPGVIIGPGFWNKGSGQLFTRIHKGLNYHFPKGTGFVGVKDVVKAMLQLMSSEIYNEGFILVAENLSFKQVLDFTAESINKPKPQKPLKKWMISIGWFVQKFASFFGYDRSITKSDINGIFQKSTYDNSKLKDKLHFKFTPIKEVIKDTGNYFVQDQDKKETTKI
ncbi:NAD-dependent epimerase/dehydratase family protein [Zunongwangia sp. SCSIO 43204]|uniref:NAD-dependent epimerase/dehydratase family protein n=1 Tax=Zunongwangia sp. SCSIO 43204 TaxID=2779359 RepID=UPI001CA881CD|nr:NAD-dependent epimerase/dehydratase family protein [Zunongwangia sp. SCSIO 43204]UAB84883.1 NAD-dependent epimerase/dehydratase family protein [Zunongwangia sp. SCSIO 43204]